MVKDFVKTKNMGTGSIICSPYLLHHQLCVIILGYYTIKTSEEYRYCIEPI